MTEGQTVVASIGPAAPVLLDSRSRAVAMALSSRIINSKTIEIAESDYQQDPDRGLRK